MEARFNYYGTTTGQKFVKYINSAGKAAESAGVPYATTQLVLLRASSLLRLNCVSSDLAPVAGLKRKKRIACGSLRLNRQSREGKRAHCRFSTFSSSRTISGGPPLRGRRISRTPRAEPPASGSIRNRI